MNSGKSLSDLPHVNVYALKDKINCASISSRIGKLKENVSDFKCKANNTISESVDCLFDTRLRYSKVCSDFVTTLPKKLYEKQEELFAHFLSTLDQCGERTKSHVVFYSEKLLRLCTTTIIGFAEIVKTVLGFSRMNEDAFMFKLLEAKQNAVHVGIFDEQTQPLTEIQIESTTGIADNLKTNKWYYISEYSQ